MYKVCSECNEYRGLGEFYKGRAKCITCWSKLRKIHYDLNRDRLLKAKKDAYELHKDEFNKGRRQKYKPSICGYCKIEYRPDIKGRYKFCSEKCRFMKKVKIEKEGCWLWQAALTDDGYGSFVHSGKRGGTAHRASYRIFKEDFNESLLVLHKCHNPPCVNPDHLKQGTDADNAQDKVNASRQSRVRGSTKLNPEQVIEIRRLFNEEKMSKASIGRLFKVNECTIGLIVRGKSWRDI